MRLARILETGTIRSRLTGALVLLAAIPVLLFAVSLVLLTRMSGDARRIEHAASLRMGIFVVAARLEHHIANPAPLNADVVRREITRMEETLAALDLGSRSLGIVRVRDSESRARIGDTRRALHEYTDLVDRVLAEVNRGAPSSERRQEITREIFMLGHASLASTQVLVDTLESRSTQALRQLWILQAAAVLVAIGVLLVTLWAVNRYILQPLPPLGAALAQIAGGRYGVRVEVQGENELSRVAEGFNAMSRDLEAAHHALVMKQAEILEKNTELKRANMLKSQFVANMSHELRTPLHAIIGYTKLLRSGVFGELPAAMREPLEGIDETSASLLKLINDILDVAKIEAGKMDLHLAPFEISQVIGEVGEMLGPLAAGKGLELQTHSDAKVPHVVSDRDKVRRILLNLVGNAIKFTRRGRVAIELLPVGACAPGTAADTCFGIAVRDTGIGIPAADLDTIFDDFHQLDGSIAREFGGTGLGLAISRQLARHLGGDIRVQSQVGEGSTFTLLLPLFVRIDAGERIAAESPRA